jgi:hypothetical protein
VELNAKVIDEFRANEGRVGRRLRGYAAAAASQHRREVGGEPGQPVGYLRDERRYV